jgi:hypothetical protein
MSVVFLSLGEPTGTLLFDAHSTILILIMFSVTAEDLQAIAARYNVKVPVEAETHYLYLLNSLDATSKQILELPEYIDPRLKPDESTLPRKWSKPEINLLNAWSHLVSCTRYTNLFKFLFF